MTDAARKLLDAAMRLAPSERAKLAAQLLATLDDAEPDVGWEQAWVAELSRRVDEGSETESWEAVYTQLRARR
jgi:putative addiction module component (TIGR02574 family)